MAADHSRAIPITRPILPSLDSIRRDRRRTVRDADAVQLQQVQSVARSSCLQSLLDHPAPQCVSSCDVGLTLAWKALQCPPG